MIVKIWRENSKIFQYLATITGTFSVITSGINLGWTSPYLPLLLKSEDIPTTEVEGSWCAVMPLVGAPLGALSAAILLDKIGRKATILAMAPFVFLAFISMAFVKRIILISLARFVIGAVEGGLYTVMPIYLAEIAASEIRGLLTSTIALAGIIGTLFINLIGPLCTIYESSLICSVVPLMHFLSFMWMPESPYYYIKKLKFDKARVSLKILRQRQDVADELIALCAAVRRQELESSTELSRLFRIRSYRKGVLTFVILSVTNKFSGKNPFLFYTMQIFEDLGDALSPRIAVIIYSLLELISTIIAINIVDKCGRRKLMLSSAIGCSILLAIEGIYFSIKSAGSPLAQHLYWMSVISLFLYNVVFSLGLAFGPVLLVGELFPTSLKSKAACLADIFSVTMGTLASQTFFYANMLGAYVPFFMFSLACLIGSMLIFNFLIETKGKTLEQIQIELIGK